MTAKWTIYHNRRCGKSRATLDLLEEHDIDPVVVEYLKDPPDEKTLRSVIRKLRVRPKDLVRRKESVFRDLKLDLEDDDAVVAAMTEHPILIERPIVVCGRKAVLGRPPENVLKLIEAG